MNKMTERKKNKATTNTVKKEVEKVEETTNVVETISKDTTTNKVEESNIRKAIPKDLEVMIVNNTPGTLVIATRNKEVNIILKEQGNTDYVTFGNLMQIKNASPLYFKNNWIEVVGDSTYTSEDIYKALGVDKFYTNFIKIDEIEEILITKTAKEIEKIITNMSAGLKTAVTTKAKQLFDDEKLDSNATIKVLEKVLKVSFDI